MLEFQFTESLLKSYTKYGFKKVDGWLDPASAFIIYQLSKVQNELGISGGVGEIGVHHGKLFILLLLMLKKGERSFGVDIFDEQNLNIDSSGKGE
jgi:hypothetical protein